MSEQDEQVSTWELIRLVETGKTVRPTWSLNQMANDPSATVERVNYLMGQLLAKISSGHSTIAVTASCRAAISVLEEATDEVDDTQRLLRALEARVIIERQKAHDAELDAALEAMGIM